MKIFDIETEDEPLGTHESRRSSVNGEPQSCIMGLPRPLIRDSEFGHKGLYPLSGWEAVLNEKGQL